MNEQNMVKLHHDDHKTFIGDNTSSDGLKYVSTFIGIL
jgi:hypothetical protein